MNSVQPKIWGILNLTPDSFSDGDPRATIETFLVRAAQMIADGADGLDIGAESTRPGARDVSTDLELQRLEPFLERFREHYPDFPLSLDTRKSRVFAAVQKFKMTLVNDTSFLADPDLAQLAAQAGAQFVLMHSRGTPATMNSLTDYGTDVWDGLFREFELKLMQLDDLGVRRDQILLDPGFGFAKTPAQCVALFATLERFVGFAAGQGFKIPESLYLGISRKRFLEHFTGPSLAWERDACTAKLSTRAARLGFGHHRVHNVKLTREALRG